MVTLTRMTGAQFALNPDLIERVDCTPDTVITLVDGTKYIVLESLEDVVAAVRDFRAAVIGAASSFEHDPDVAVRRGRLVALPTGDDDRGDPDGDAERDLAPDLAVPPTQPGPVLPLTPRSL